MDVIVNNVAGISLFAPVEGVYVVDIKDEDA